MGNYYQNRAWADRYHKEVFHHLKTWFYKFGLRGTTTMSTEVADWQEDVEYATDYVLRLNTEIKMAGRVRSRKYEGYFDWDTTLREHNGKSQDTELKKFLEGRFPPYYGVFIGNDDGSIRRGKLLDMELLRREMLGDNDRFMKVMSSSKIPWDNPNQRFVTVEYNDFPGLILDSF